MNTVTAIFLLSIVGFSYATPSWYNPTPSGVYSDKKNAAALLESLLEQNNQNVEEEEDDMAELEGFVNVMAQVDIEKANVMDDKSAMAQFWKGIGKVLLKTGKTYLRNKYCSEENKMREMMEELVGEQGIQGEENEATEEEDDEALAELQNLLSALKKVEAKIMQGEATTEESNATTEGWWKKLRKSLKKNVKKVAKGYLC